MPGFTDGKPRGTSNFQVREDEVDSPAEMEREANCETLLAEFRGRFDAITAIGMDADVQTKQDLIVAGQQIKVKLDELDCWEHQSQMESMLKQLSRDVTVAQNTNGQDISQMDADLQVLNPMIQPSLEPVVTNDLSIL